MASVEISNVWSDPTSGLTTGNTYVVQNKSTQAVQFYEGAAFSAATNDGDGVILVPTNSTGSGPNHMRWSYDSARQVRVRMLAAPFGDGNTLEFAPAS